VVFVKRKWLKAVEYTKIPGFYKTGGEGVMPRCERIYVIHEKPVERTGH